MSRPYSSDQHQSAFGGAPLEYDRRVVLRPDVVTESLAYLTASLINSGPQSENPVSVLELGVGAAPFLAWVADRTSPNRALALEGVDIDPQVLPYGQYNVDQVLSRRNNDQDSFFLQTDNWHEFLTGRRYDYIYFNPPYLPEGESVREDYQQTPASSMYVAGSVDGLDHYQQLMPLLKDTLNPHGRLVVRMPRDNNRVMRVRRIVEDVFGNEVVIHSTDIESEMEDRTGAGLVVDTNPLDPFHFKSGLIRGIGLGIIHREVAA